MSPEMVYDKATDTHWRPIPGLEIDFGDLPVDDQGRLLGFVTDTNGRHPVGDLWTSKTHYEAA